MLQFEHTIYLWALVFLPLMAFLFFTTSRWKRKARDRFADSSLLSILLPDVSDRKPILKFVLFSLAYLLLVVGLANPQVGSKTEEIKREGIDLMIAVDVSNSMKAEDLSPNRLERTKRAIEKLVENLKNDRVGLIVFAGDAFVQLPITSDYAAAKLFTTTISTEIIPTQGTAIGLAIREGIRALGKDETKSRALIVITDGENHEDDAVEAAKEAAAKGINVYTIGMGSIKGAPIPVRRNGQARGFRKDQQGNTIISKLNQQMLQEIAAAGKGSYVRASNANAGLNAILDEIDKLEKTTYDSKVYTDYEDHFQPFLIAAFLLLLIDFLIGHRKSKWIQQINLFGTQK